MHTFHRHVHYNYNHIATAHESCQNELTIGMSAASYAHGNHIRLTTFYILKYLKVTLKQPPYNKI